MTVKKSHNARPHYRFTYNPYNHRGILEVVDGLRGETYIARSKKEFRKLEIALSSLAEPFSQAVGAKLDPACDGVLVSLLDLVSTDEELEEARLAAEVKAGG